MKSLVQMGVGAVMLIGAAVMGNQFMKEDRAEAAQRFGLSEIDVPIMRMCESQLSAGNLEYASGVEPIIGCGCITRQMRDSVPKTEASIAPKVLEFMLRMAALEEDGEDSTPVSNEAEAWSKENSITEVRMLKTFDHVLAAVEHCSNPSVYLTPEEVAADAVAKAEQADKTRAALKIAVERGHMTQTEADERLARMNARP